ncbi:MAG: penicillin-binding protein 1A [Alphaproteobacteria bacterium]|nr:penicillin-binding protein 1A [Alphaproteobacteria bacterium]MCB9928663.1 penicillin-binding protein 1A [Alphaproteobacteria bacterium]
MKRWLLRGLWAYLVVMVIGLAAGLAAVYHFASDLPDNRALEAYVPPITTRLYAENGELMAEYATENRVFVPIEEVPPMVKNAFLAAEDNNFYQHHGIDVRGILRAAVTNLRNIGTGRRLVGGSTITQQVAKNFSLSSEVSWQRKIKEAILAFRIERALPKDRILELYLNEIYLGAGAYGIGAAAERYFGKTLDELHPGEIAFLAGLPKAPSAYNPVRNHDEALARRNVVLQRMADEGLISEAVLTSERALPLEAPGLDKTGKQPAPWFAEQVRRELANEFGNTKLYEGGLSVRTTMDPRLQTIAQAALRRGLEVYDRRHGYRGPVARIDLAGDWQKALAAVEDPDPGTEARLAVVREVGAQSVAIAFADGSKGTLPFGQMEWAGGYEQNSRRVGDPKRPSDVVSAGDVILVRPFDTDGKPLDKGDFALTQAPAVDGALIAVDPYTGRMLAMVGGYNARRSEFNRAVQAKRQPGSAFKPFVYLTALDNGFTPATIIQDAPFVMRDPTVLGSGWKPSNYSSGRFYGPSPMRLGIEFSRNLMTVRLANAVGMDKIAATAARFDVIEDMAPVLAMALGSGETTLLKLTTAYAMLVNGGKRVQPSFIDRIQNRFGKTEYRHDARPCPDCSGPAAILDAVPLPDWQAEQVDDPVSIYQIVSMLQGVIDRGTAKRARIPGVPLAGKTGTSNDARDTWFIGFSSNLAVGVFVGFDQPASLGPHEAGGVVAAPIFGDFMKQALDFYPAHPFRAPEGVRFVRIDRKTGKLPSPGDTDVILEAFRPGTEPGAAPQATIADTPDDQPQPATDTEATRVRKRMGGIY